MSDGYQRIWAKDHTRISHRCLIAHVVLRSIFYYEAQKREIPDIAGWVHSDGAVFYRRSSMVNLLNGIFEPRTDLRIDGIFRCDSG